MVSPDQVNVPVIQNVASGKVNVDLSKAAEGQISFSGPNPVIFGFKAVQVMADQEAHYQLLKPAEDGAIALRKAGSLTDKDVALLDLSGEGVFFDLTESAEDRKQNVTVVA